MQDPLARGQPLPSPPPCAPRAHESSVGAARGEQGHRLEAAVRVLGKAGPTSPDSGSRRDWKSWQFATGEGWGRAHASLRRIGCRGAQEMKDLVFHWNPRGDRGDGRMFLVMGWSAGMGETRHKVRYGRTTRRARCRPRGYGGRSREASSHRSAAYSAADAHRARGALAHHAEARGMTERTRPFRGRPPVSSPRCAPRGAASPGEMSR